jgi:hypothetical protein
VIRPPGCVYGTSYYVETAVKSSAKALDEPSLFTQLF